MSDRPHTAVQAERSQRLVDVLRERGFTVKVQADRCVDFAIWVTLIHPDRKSKTHAKGGTILTALEAATALLDAPAVSER